MAVLCNDDCPCRAAVTRAYRELRQRGVGDRQAFRAALVVYRNHHPETGSTEATYTTADWIADELGQ